MEIEKIYEDVLSFTDDDLRLNNKSKPQLESGEEFYRILEKESRKANIEIPELEVTGLIDNNLIIHLNYHAIEGELFRELSAKIIAFFQPYAVFLERTELGGELLKSGKLNKLSEKYYLLDGIGIWVEEETEKRLKTKGYHFERLHSELTKKWELSQYHKDRSSDIDKARDICRRLWRDAVKADLSKLYGQKKAEPNEIIVASILYASADVFKDFNTTFLELENMPISEIFVKSGLYLEAIEKLIPPEEIKEVEDCVKKLGYLVGLERPIGDIKGSLKKIEEVLLQLDKNYRIEFPDEIDKRVSKLYEIIKDHPAMKRIEEIPDPLYKTSLQNLLIDIEKFIDRYK